MKWFRFGLIATLIAAALPIGDAYAHGRGGHRHGGHHGFHLGVIVGAPLFWPWHYRPYYDSPPVVVAPSGPPVYVERSTAQNSYWYYCADADAYYPYVKECPGGWRRETPRAPE